MKKFFIIMLVITLTLTFIACGGSGNSTSVAADDPAVTTTELTVWGMFCGRCETRIKNAVSGLEGVIDVSVNLRDETVTVEHEPELKQSEIESAITALGFNVP